jgi:metal-sulfur cluster biosynthetic enzyme
MNETQPNEQETKSSLPVHSHTESGCCGGNKTSCDHEQKVASESTSACSVLSEDRVREELKQVIDPELFVNIVDLGLIYDVDIQPQEDGKQVVKIEMTMTSPMCPAGPQLVSQSQAAVEKIEGVTEVEIKVVMDPPWTPDRMTEDARDQLGIF